MSAIDTSIWSDHLHQPLNDLLRLHGRLRLRLRLRLGKHEHLIDALRRRRRHARVQLHQPREALALPHLQGGGVTAGGATSRSPPLRSAPHQRHPPPRSPRPRGGPDSDIIRSPGQANSPPQNSPIHYSRRGFCGPAQHASALRELYNAQVGPCGDLGRPLANGKAPIAQRAGMALHRQTDRQTDRQTNR
eukprot:4360447-Pyramimonas_sp.AAC.2